MNHGAIEARVCGDATPRIFKYADECSVPSCSHKLNNTRFYKVPRNPEMARLYRESMNIAEGVDVSSWNICEDHFSENDFVSFGNVRTLKIVAIPSRNLPKLKRGQPFFLEKGAAGGQKLGELVSNTQLTLIGQSELQQRRTRPKFQDSKLQVQKIQEELRLLGQAWIKENKMPAKIAEAQEIAKNAQHQKDPIDEYQLVSLPELTKLENTLCSICLETKREKMKDVNALFQGQPIKLVIEFTFSIELKFNDAVTDICNKCLERLKISYSFRKECVSSVEVIESTNINNSSEKETVPDCSSPQLTRLTEPTTLSAKKINQKLEDLFEFELEILKFKKVVAKNVSKPIATSKVISNSVQLVQPSICKPAVSKKAESEPMDWNERQDKSETDSDSDMISSEDEEDKIAARAIRLANLKNAGPRFQYNCVLCKIKFRKVKDKVSHYKNHHMKEDGTFLCTICNQVFQNYAKLQIHLRHHFPNDQVNQAIKRFLCQICGKAFTFKKLMHTCESNHSLTKEERLEVYKLAAKFQCPQCDTRLLTAARLKMHIRVRHDRIRDFKCDNCDASYTSGVALRRHQLIHGAEPEFKCVSCAKGFVVENEFLRHLKNCSDK